MKSTGEHEISRLYDQVGSGGELRQTLWGAPPFFTVAAVITVIAVTTTAGPHARRGGAGGGRGRTGGGAQGGRSSLQLWCGERNRSGEGSTREGGPVKEMGMGVWGKEVR